MSNEDGARPSSIANVGVPIFTLQGDRVGFVIGLAASFSREELEESMTEQEAFVLCEKKREQMRRTLDQATRDLFRHLDEARRVSWPGVDIQFPPLAMEGRTL